MQPFLFPDVISFSMFSNGSIERLHINCLFMCEDY